MPCTVPFSAGQASTAQICALGLRKVRFLTNNPKKRVGLEAYGLSVVEQVSIESTPNPHNLRYLETKRDKMGHITLLPGSELEKGNG